MCVFFAFMEKIVKNKLLLVFVGLVCLLGSTTVNTVQIVKRTDCYSLSVEKADGCFLPAPYFLCDNDSGEPVIDFSHFASDVKCCLRMTGAYTQQDNMPEPVRFSNGHFLCFSSSEVVSYYIFGLHRIIV